MIPTSAEIKPSPSFMPMSARSVFTPSNGQCATPSHGQIANCAYDIYIEHGRVDGRSEQNWLQAEEELAQNAQAAAHKSAVNRQV